MQYTHKLLDPLWSQNHHSLGHQRQIQHSDVFNQSHPTCAVQFLQSETQPGPGCGSLFLDVFSLALAFTFTFWAGCDLALSLTSWSIRECIFVTCPAVECSSCTLVQNQHWASLCPIRQHQVQNPPNFRCSPRSVESESFMHVSLALRATTLSKVVRHSSALSTIHWAFTSWSDESSLTRIITRKLLAFLFLCQD